VVEEVSGQKSNSNGRKKGRKKINKTKIFTISNNHGNVRQAGQVAEAGGWPLGG
jgi:hypothetical protein